MNKKTHQINIKVDEELHDAIVALAHSQGMDISEFARDLLIQDLIRELDKLSVLHRWASRTGNLSNEGNQE